MKAHYLIGAFLYKLIENNGKIVGHVQSVCPLDTGKAYYKVSDVLNHYPCVFIGEDELSFSKILTERLNFTYEVYVEGDTRRLIKRDSFLGETIHKWGKNKDLTKSYHLINDLMAWDSMPIGAKEKDTYDLIGKSYPHFNVSQSDLRSSCSSFKFKDDTFTFLYVGVVLDSEYRAIHPSEDKDGIYFWLNEDRVPLSYILTYNIQNLRL